MDKALDVQHLSLSLLVGKREINIVDDISFCLRAGETTVLLGESGCGKSLTSLALMRLLPRSGLYGQKSALLLSDGDILELPEKLMRALRGRRLAMVFQEPMTALNPVLSIGTQLAEALTQHYVLNSAELKRQMIKLLTDVEMPDPEQCLQQYPHELSGGQKQRIVIAQALAGKPDILIADEPTTALDVTIQAQILSLLKKLQVEHNMSVLLITHDLSVVQYMATWVCVMYAGQIVELASVGSYFRQPLHPYSQQLFASLPSMAKRNQHLHVIPGHVPSMDNKPTGCSFHPRCPHAFVPCQSVEPILQELPRGLKVRCHLYPKHQFPPALTDKDEIWKPKKSDNNEIVMSVDGLSVNFALHGSSATFKAVDNISFSLEKGKTLALVGESGSGKTTVCRALLRLQEITSGAVYYRDKRIDKLHGRDLRNFRRHVQIVFQDPFSSMNPRMTVASLLAEGMEAQGIKPALIRKKQYKLLDQVNLPQGSLQRYPHQFSGGQRQRICIARALAVDPEVLICDEPTSALDVSVQAQILNLLKTLQEEFQLSYLFITHNMGVVSYIADDVLVMHHGAIVERGKAESIINNPQHPYTQKLLASVLS